MSVIDCSAMIELLAAKTQTGDAIARRVSAAQILYAPYVLDGEIISPMMLILLMVSALFAVVDLSLTSLAPG